MVTAGDPAGRHRPHRLNVVGGPPSDSVHPVAETYDPAMTPAAVPLGSFDLSDPEFWLQPRDFREGAFRALREEPQLQFFKEWVFPDSPFPVGPGYYALTRHEDV